MNDCEECRRLREAEASAHRAWQEQRYVNVKLHVKNTHSGRNAVKSLEQSYTLACAESRLHRAKCHAEEGHRATMEDVGIVLRKGRKGP